MRRNVVAVLLVNLVSLSLVGCTATELEADQTRPLDGATASETPFVLTQWESTPLEDQSLLGEVRWNDDGTRVTISTVVDGCGAGFGQLSVKDSTHVFIDYAPSLDENCATVSAPLTYSAMVPPKITRQEVVYIEFGEGIGMESPLTMPSLTDTWSSPG
jgi:hypothetical protein